MTTISLYKKLFRIAAEKKLWLRVLGEVNGYPIWFAHTGWGYKEGRPRILIVAGFHGSEPAGPISIIQWLEAFDTHLYRKVNLGFIPVVNPVGFNNHKRYNHKRQKNNCGFCHPENGDLPSEEGIILIKNSNLLIASARDGFLSLHEDAKDEHGPASSKFYLYSFEHSQEPGQITMAMKEELGKFFPTPLNEEYVTTDARGDQSVFVKDGLIYKLCDGSCEDWLFHEGSKITMATETPGTYPLKKRIEADVAIISKFIEQVSIYT